MLVKTKGIVLRVVRYSETSLIVSIFTEELGLKTYFLKGVRHAKKKGNLFQPMQQLELIVNQRDNKKMQYIKEFKPRYIFDTIFSNLHKTAIGLLMTEALNFSISEGEKEEDLYHFVEQSFVSLDQARGEFANHHIVFLLELSKQLGFSPMNNFSEQCNCFALQDGFFVSEKDGYPNTISSDDSKLFFDFMTTKQLRNSKQRRNVLGTLERYYQHHIESFRPFVTPTIYGEVF